MRLTRPALVIAAAFAVAALPAHGSEVQLGARVTWTATDDAAMCFTFRPGTLTAGTATAAGLVYTGPVDWPDLPDLPEVLPPIHMAGPPATLVSEVRPLASASGYGDVCVGGTGGHAVSGRATFTLSVHTATSDHVTVVECTYGFFGPDCA